MKPSGIGGMAVMEGVMMKNKEAYAVAVRKPNNEIVVEKNTHKDISNKLQFFKLPVFRGILAFVDSLVLGVKVLNFSASFFEEDEKKDSKSGKKGAKKPKVEDLNIEEISATNMDGVDLSTDDSKDDKANALMMVFAVLFSIVISIALFMVLPVLLSDIFKHFIKSYALINLIEGVIRFGIFIGYVYLASRMNEIKRVFMYHGAEHKAINCIEQGYELTVENVRLQSKVHKRCGTSFTLLVILISLVFFMLIPTGDLLIKVISRVVFVPFIAGFSYEIIRLAGRSENKVVEIISKPGLWMQALTTKEPDDSMIEVAIKSVDAVFDWKTFVNESSIKLQTEEAAAIAKQEEEEALKDTATEDAKSTEKAVAKGKKTKKKATVSEPKAAEVIETDTKEDEIAEENSEAKSAVNNKSKAENEKPVKSNTLNRSIPITKSSKDEEEDDEILKALDKFFDEDSAKFADEK